MSTSAEEAYKLLENQTLWHIAMVCHRDLDAASIPHAILGGVAVCLHGYQRNTVDIDLLIRREDSQRVKSIFHESGILWRGETAEFVHPSGIPVHLLLAGERAGKGSEVTLPDPVDESTIQFIEGLPVIRLARVIESKIACGEGNLRRTHKDFADVVELIAFHKLDSSYARFLHKSVRTSFRRLVKHGRDDA